MSFFNISGCSCGAPVFWEPSSSCALRNYRLEHGWEYIGGKFLSPAAIGSLRSRTGVKPMSDCNPGFCCGSCNTAMSTVNPTPGICQSPTCCGGCGGAGSTQSLLNTIGKYGTTLAGVFAGRPVVTTRKGVSVGPSAQYQAARTVSFTPVLLIVGVVIIAFMYLSGHRA